MNARHTPGPWYDDGYRIYAPTDDDDKRNGRVIVEYKHVDDFNLADAPLLSAAPDLLAALEQVLKALAEVSETANCYCEKEVTAAEAAMAKATGGRTHLTAATGALSPVDLP